jgi:threonine/homoserine/homoserine lactone efflux protein
MCNHGCIGSWYGLEHVSVPEAAIATGLIVVAPGPALAISVSSAVDGGRRAGLLAIAGLAAGIVLHAGVAAAGLAVLFASDSRVRGTLQVAGALFLVLVGTRMILRGLRGAPTAHQQATTPPGAYLARGLLTNVFNPWILGFYLTMLPVVAGAGSQSPFLAAALVAGIHVAQLAAWHGFLVVTVASAAQVYGSRGPALRVAAGVALIATAAWFMFR